MEYQRWMWRSAFLWSMLWLPSRRRNPWWVRQLEEQRGSVSVWPSLSRTVQWGATCCVIGTVSCVSWSGLWPAAFNRITLSTSLCTMSTSSAIQQKQQLISIVRRARSLVCAKISYYVNVSLLFQYLLFFIHLVFFLSAISEVFCVSAHTISRQDVHLSLAWGYEGGPCHAGEEMVYRDA